MQIQSRPGRSSEQEGEIAAVDEGASVQRNWANQRISGHDKENEASCSSNLIGLLTHTGACIRQAVCVSLSSWRTLRTQMHGASGAG